MNAEIVMMQTVLSNWKLAVNRTSSAFGKMSAERFYTEIAPGRNRPVYLLGHLTAVHDAMFTILGMGARLRPELDAVFVTKPDRETKELPSLPTLKGYWTQVNDALLSQMLVMPPEMWLTRHMAMTDEEFAKEPSRNRLSVLMNRTGHCSFHLGQLVLARD